MPLYVVWPLLSLAPSTPNSNPFWSNTCLRCRLVLNKKIFDKASITCILSSMYCKKCKTTEGYLTVSNSRYRKDGTRYVQYTCRPCNAERKRNEKKDAQRKAEKNSRARYPDKLRARILARKKIPLEPCEVCGEKAGRHHPNYSEPLKVRFLCPLHHKQVHQGVLCLK